MDLSRAKATFAILCGAAGLALTAGHLNIRPPRPEIVRFASNAAFRDGVYQGKLDAQHGSKPHIRSARWSQIGWLSFPGTSSDIRTAQAGADRANVLWGAMLPRSDSCCYSEFARCNGCGAPCRETKLCGRQHASFKRSRSALNLLSLPTACSACSRISPPACEGGGTSR